MHYHRVSPTSAFRILDGLQSGHSFFHEHLMPTLKDITSRGYREHSNKAYFEIIKIGDDTRLKLAITPLTECRDKYLCLYLQLPPEMHTDGHQQIISKLINVIQ